MCPGLNPFPTHFTYNVKFVSVTSPSALRRPGDRPRTILGRVWIGTMNPHSQGPTARSRARSLGLGVALASTVVNVPTAARGMVAMTASHVRGPPLRMSRLIGPRDIGTLRLMSAGQVQISRFNNGLTVVTGPSTARQNGQITAVTSQIAASSLTQHGLPLSIRRLAEKRKRELG